MSPSIKHTWLDIIPDGAAWAVRCQSAQYGRYRTQAEAFNAAVAEARKFHELGRVVNVRVLREESGDHFVSLL
jgi:hypothetical protein